MAVVTLRDLDTRAPSQVRGMSLGTGPPLRPGACLSGQGPLSGQGHVSRDRAPSQVRGMSLGTGPPLRLGACLLGQGQPSLARGTSFGPRALP